jgi:hypothetical protein
MAAVSDTPRWLRIALVAVAGLVTACSSGSAEVRAGADPTTVPSVPSVPPTAVTTTDPAPPAATTTTVAATRDACGADPIVDADGYLEGRHDAEAGRPYQIDDAPAPTAEDDDDDDATVGPQTRYRAGYSQGWCDGSAG